MAMGAETEQDRSKRHYQRTLFDGVAGLYEASRLGYPKDIVEFVVTTAAVGPLSKVLEVGCGTGQLTERLAGFGFSLTAIDIGPSMIAEARHRLAGSAVSFRVASFEDFPAAEASFDLIVSGAAFHWVDPTGWFAEPIHRASAQRIVRPADVVIGVENTRATSLSWPDDVRRRFTEELARHLESQGDVHLTQQTSVTMAGILPGDGCSGQPASSTDLGN